ncbi:MAG: sigma-70 family RNA polymerase sigma factor [Anaerolineaceae bacterium]|nr:sigma-70 family RNA polymerase sigma factor [Anaerolineaceae bacterium]
MNHHTAEELQSAINGDEAAFAHLVETYQTPVYNLCCRMLGDPQEAEDAAQESFWRAHQAMKRYDPNRPFITWLLSIAAHYCIDQQRKRRLPIIELDEITEELIPYNAPNPESVVCQSEEEQMLHALLSEMKAQDRAALILRYWYDFSDQEIGKALSCSVSAVKSRLHRARLQMAQKWQSAQQTVTSPERSYDETPTF